MDMRHNWNGRRINLQTCVLNKLFILCFLLTILLQLAIGRTYNDPEYDWSYLDDDCQPYNDTDDPEKWNRRVKNLTDGSSRLYGYVQPEKDTVYRGPLNCAVKVVAPPGYKLVVRIPRVEIYHDETECVNDYMSVIGATNELPYCGFGTVTHSIYSTSNWLIFKILASEWDANHDYIGFLLYYTAVHSGQCNSAGPNTTEWRCGGMNWCTPSEVICDTKDNCGAWEDEKASVCGLTEGAIVAISVVSILVGGTALFFIGYCIYNHHKQKQRTRARRSVVPTMTIGHGANGGHVVMSPVPPTLSGHGAGAEPPPPYTPQPYINLGFADMPNSETTNIYNTLSDPTENTNSMTGALNTTAATDTTATLGNNISVRYATAASLRPAAGEPPPLYAPPSDGQVAGAGADGVAQQPGGVSFAALPEKTDA